MGHNGVSRGDYLKVTSLGLAVAVLADTKKNAARRGFSRSRVCFLSRVVGCQSQVLAVS
jgi:hypothetical protein